MHVLTEYKRQLFRKVRIIGIQHGNGDRVAGCSNRNGAVHARRAGWHRAQHRWRQLRVFELHELHVQMQREGLQQLILVHQPEIHNDLGQ